jgi:hypothetical protein
MAETKPTFKKITKRSSDPLIDFPLKFNRIKSPCQKYMLTLITYGNAVHRVVIQDFVKMESDGQMTVVTTDNNEAWQSPVYATKKEAVSETLKFIRDHL